MPDLVTIIERALSTLVTSVVVAGVVVWLVKRFIASNDEKLADLKRCLDEINRNLKSELIRIETGFDEAEREGLQRHAALKQELSEIRMMLYRDFVQKHEYAEQARHLMEKLDRLHAKLDQFVHDLMTTQLNNRPRNP